MGELLVNHTIANINVIDRDTCEYRCYLNHNCVSVNFYFGPSEAGIQNCELNNSTKKKQDKDLTKAANYVYHGTQVRINYLLAIILIHPKLKWKFLRLLMHLPLSQCLLCWKIISNDATDFFLSFFRMLVIVLTASTTPFVNLVLQVRDIDARVLLDLQDLIVNKVRHKNVYIHCISFYLQQK